MPRLVVAGSNLDDDFQMADGLLRPAAVKQRIWRAMNKLRVLLQGGE